MTDDAAPPAGSALRRATDGRMGVGASLADPRSWREMAGAHGLPALLLIAVFIAVEIGIFIDVLSGRGLEAWGLSATALADGRWSLLGTHMFAHAGFAHLLGNSGALLALSTPVMARFRGARSPAAWLRYAVLFGLSGLCGAVLFLAIHPTSDTPMVGASGAICGLWGATARIGLDGRFIPILSRNVWREVKAFARMNLVLFLILFVYARLMHGGVGGLAWEAHLGGFLFGLLTMPLIAPRVPPAAWDRLFGGRG